MKYKFYDTKSQDFSRKLAVESNIRRTSLVNQFSRRLSKSIEDLKINATFKCNSESSDHKKCEHVGFKMHQDPLVVGKLFKAIGVRANWMGGRIFLVLERGGKRIEQIDLFGRFDFSFCQTDIILTEKDKIVSKAKIGDSYFLCNEQ